MSVAAWLVHAWTFLPRLRDINAREIEVTRREAELDRRAVEVKDHLHQADALRRRLARALDELERPAG